MPRKHTTSIAARFSAAAETYDQTAQVQKNVAEHVTALLAGIPAPQKILEIGCGTGLLTGMLCRALPRATIHALDLSAGMLAQAQTLLGNRANVQWILADARQLPAGATYDLLVSSSSLHWIQPLADLFQTLRPRLITGGHLVFGLMLKDTLKELHAARRRVAPDNPTSATLPTEADVLAALQSAHFQVLQHERTTLRVQYPAAAQLLQAVHEQGTTGGAVSQGRRPLLRGEMRRLLDDYTTHYSNATSGGVFATYDVLYVVARSQEVI